MNFMPGYSVGDIVALIAAVVSFVALYRTRKFNELQTRILEIQSKLGELQIERELTEIKAKEQCGLGVNLVKVGSEYKMRVFNRGPARASTHLFEITGSG